MAPAWEVLQRDYASETAAAASVSADQHPLLDAANRIAEAAKKAAVAAEEAKSAAAEKKSAAAADIS